MHGQVHPLFSGHLMDLPVKATVFYDWIVKVYYKEHASKAICDIILSSREDSVVDIILAIITVL